VASALGYSGIIFAQFFYGLAEKLKDYDQVLPEVFTQASSQAFIRAYEALNNPQEGTVLTVLKEWSEELKKLARKIDDFGLLFSESLKRAVSALKDTPNKLEILRKYNVVDAGGKAFVYFLEGIIHFMEKGEPLPGSSDKRKIQVSFKEKYPEDEKKEIRLCAECCVRRENLDRLNLIEKINSLGHDLIFYGSLNFAKIHLKTNRPDDVFSCVAQFGDITSKKILKFAADTPTSHKKPIALVFDTTCDIADEYIEDNDMILSSSPTLPKTSQPSLMEFSSIYEHLLVHYQTIISIHLSGKLSGTFQTAFQAANDVDSKKITALDGKNISVGLGLVGMEGIEAIKEGLSHEGVLERIKNAIEDVEVFIGLPTLKYLVKGGRITKAKGLMARILNINPILSINREGILKPVGKTRGKKRLEQKILDMASAKMREAKEARFSVAVAHTNAPQVGKKIAEKIRQRLRTEVAMVMNASPALGVHAGPGVIGIGVVKSVKNGREKPD